MTPEQFESRARSCQTRQDLENLKANTMTRGRTDLAEIAHRLLDELFPARTRKGRGATPSQAVFRGHAEDFSTGKDGYVWLVEQFGLYKPSIYIEYEEFHRKRASSGCRLSRTPEALFPEGSNRSEVASNYAAVVGGWYVDTNLNHVGKFALLMQLGYLAKLKYPADWELKIDGSTEELADRQRAVLRAQKILAGLLAQ